MRIILSSSPMSLKVFFSNSLFRLLTRNPSVHAHGSDAEASKTQQFSLLVLASHCITAIVVLDTWHYFMHRYMHHNNFLYKHIHSQHHRLVVPYSYGALYNHPIEGLLLDTVGGALSFLISDYASPEISSISCLRTTRRIMICIISFMETNFTSLSHVGSQILGTYMPYSLEKRKDDGFEA